MRPTVLVIFATSLLSLMPVESSGMVTFRRLDNLRGGFLSEDLKEALNSQHWIAGTEFVGWGQNTTTLYYQGDVQDFQTFLQSLRRVETAAIVQSHEMPAEEVRTIGDGDVATTVKKSLPPRLKLATDAPTEFETSVLPFPGTMSGPILQLAPGRGWHASRVGLREDFPYDWKISVTITLTDELNGPDVRTVSDEQGQTVQRRIARRPVLIPHLTTRIIWHVGDGSMLSDIEFPSGWLLDEESTLSRSIYLPLLSPDAINEETLLASERIERYLAREQHEYQQSEEAWRISEFYGITIDLDVDASETPTIIAKHRGDEARFNIETGERLTDDAPFSKTAASLVDRWLEQERTVVLEQWEHARNGEPIEMVEPLE